MIEKIDDKKLIEFYLAGDEKSLEILIAKYLKPIYSFVYRNVGGQAEAEDITQDVFVKVWKNIRKFDQKKSFKPWIFQIAKNASIDFLRKKKAVPFSRFENEKGQNLLTDALPNSPVDLISILNNRQILEAATKDLSKEEKEIINLYHEQGLTFREIAEKLKKSINTIKSRYRRAIFLLRAKIKL